MLSKDGFLELEEITVNPGFPGEEVFCQKKCVMIECAQEIPCNPCEEACPHHAITIGSPITNLPEVDKDKCIGCGLCVAKCPGQAIFLVDQTGTDYDTVTIPYEYYPLPVKNQEVYCLSRAGQFVVKGEIVKVVMAPVNDRTAVVEVKVPKGYGMTVRGISTDGTRMAAEEMPEKATGEMLEAIDEEHMYVCRCEEITKAEVLEAVRSGAASVNEVKRMLRPGMGLCQGRNCNKTIERLISQELHIPPAEVPQSTKRGPVRPVKMSAYTTLDVEATEDFFEHDW